MGAVWIGEEFKLFVVVKEHHRRTVVPGKAGTPATAGFGETRTDLARPIRERAVFGLIDAAADLL
jgi:hypothetical protein